MIDIMFVLIAVSLMKLAVMAWRASRRKSGLSTDRPPATITSTVSVIVPAWNDAAVLPRCLESVLVEMKRSGFNTELVVVAGGDDGTLEIASAFRRSHPWAVMTVLPQSPRGKNAALNDGVRCTSGEILVFVDADTQVGPHWLSELVTPIILGQAQATTANFRPYRMTPISNVFVIEQAYSQMILGEGGLFGGGTIAVCKKMFDTIGGLPEDVVAGVDWDLTQRIRQSGGSTMFVASAQVLTEISESWPQYWRGEVRWRRAWWILQWQQARAMALYSLLISAGLIVSVVSLGAMLWLPADAHEAILLGIMAITIWTIGPYVVRGGIQYVRIARAFPKPLDGLVYLGAVYVSCLALIVGVGTMKRHTPHFKGPRSSRVGV